MRAQPMVVRPHMFVDLRRSAVGLVVLAALSVCQAAGAQTLEGEASLARIDASAKPPAAGAPEGLRIMIETPSHGGVVESRSHMAEVRGTAVAAGEGPSGFDVIVVLDVSQSTRYASGTDVDGDGEIGEDPNMGLFAPGEYAEDVYSTDPEDTVLAAEVAAARALLASVDPARVRVGLISFSGEVDPDTGRQLRRDQRDATVEVPLTNNFARLHAALDDVLARGPHGATNFAAGIRLATTELSGMSGALSQPNPDTEKITLFLTDGVPTFPIGQANVQDDGDLEAAVNAAKVAREAGIRINTYALGTGALGRPLAATEVARVTLGSFTPVLEPGAIVAALQTVSFANIEDVGILNLTLREGTPDVRLNPDGTFVGFVPVQEGSNRVLVNAVASDGSEANVELTFDFAIEQSKGDMAERDLARLRELNNNLLVHLEAERIKRERRRLRMEKELEIRSAE